jgi:hypothetical protein
MKETDGSHCAVEGEQGDYWRAGNTFLPTGGLPFVLA